MGLFSGVGYNNSTFSGFPGTGSFRGYYASRPSAPQPYGNGMFSPQGSSMGYGGYGGMGGYQNPQTAYMDNRAPQDSLGTQPQMAPWLQSAMAGMSGAGGFDGSTQNVGNGVAMRQMAPSTIPGMPVMSTPYQVNPAMTGGSASTIPQEVGSASNPNLPVLPPYNSRPHWGDGLQQAFMGAAQQYQAQLAGGMKPGFVNSPSQAAPTSGYVNPFMGMGQANVNTGAVLDSRVGQGNAGLWDYALGRR